MYILVHFQQASSAGKNKYGIEIKLLAFTYCTHSLAFEFRLHGPIPHRVHAP